MEILKSIIDPGVAPIVGAIISAAVSVNILFMKWLIKSFSDLRECISRLSTEIKHLSKEYETLLDIHEAKDQNRHEENLKRFENISISLAKIEK